MDTMIKKYCALALLAFSMPCFPLSALEKQAMQDQLNQQTLAKPFDANNPADLKAYLDDAVKKGVKPPLEPSPHWRRGYTCDNILSYGYTGYRNCMLYYRYYGCYYC